VSYPVDLDAIERLAKAATPGKRSTFCVGVKNPPTGLVLHFSAQGQGVQSDSDGGVHVSADDNLCAALDPATVLTLLALARRAQGACCELCSIDDGLVREWVQKAREVANSKGLLRAPGAAAREEEKD